MQKKVPTLSKQYSYPSRQWLAADNGAVVDETNPATDENACSSRMMQTG